MIVATPLVRGTVAASAFLIDVGTLGIEPTRRRILGMYCAGVVVRRVDNARLLVELPTPDVVHSARCPGMPLAAEGDHLVSAPGVATAAGIDRDRPAALCTVEHGELTTRRIDELPVVDPATWIFVDVDTVVRTRALDCPSTRPREVSAVAEVDLRSDARVGAPTEAAKRFLTDLNPAAPPPSTRPAASHPKRLESSLSKLLLRSPLAAEIGRRHDRYLQDLTRRFQAGDLDEALRRAVPLGGTGRGGTSIRVPTRRNSLRLSIETLGGGASVPVGPTINEHLTSLYRDAAATLERRGQIDEAAFVLADLLDAPLEAVALLERARRWDVAAALAQGRQLDPGLIVRLWFLAGERYRAVMVARRHGVFEDAVVRLGSDDPELALALRRDWVEANLASGDLLGAVEAAWPEPSLRPVVADTIDRAVRLGGQLGARLRAHRIVSRPSAEARDELGGFLDGDGSTVTERRLFALTLAELHNDDPVVDRETCSVTVRSLVADGLDDGTAGKVTEAGLQRLARRADPILAADLPTRDVRATMSGRPPTPRPPLWVEAPAAAGTTLYDAAYLPSGNVLVALGPLGVALLRPDGRRVARWDVPTDELVVADHGNRALLLSRRGELTEVHTLDLADRSTRRWGVLRLRQWTSSFDGATWIAIDELGLAVLDTTTAQPVVTWRELDQRWSVLDLQRSSGSLAAVVAMPEGTMFAQARTERWQWALPSMRLHLREQCRLEDWSEWAIQSSGEMISAQADRFDPSEGWTVLGGGGVRRFPYEFPPRIVRNASVIATVSTSIGDTGGQRVDIWTKTLNEPSRIVFAGASAVRVRCTGGPVTVCDPAGRVVVIDHDHGDVIVRLRVRLA